MKRRINIFREIKRIISQFFETEYWYRFRKVSHFWYDDEDNKFVSSPSRANESLNCTWDGEGDILNMMRLKIEHMFFNLKKYSMHKDFYIDSYKFFDKEATDNDRTLFMNQIIKEGEEHPKDFKYSSEFNHTENWTNELRCKISDKKTKECCHKNYTNEWWIGNEYVDKSISDSGLAHYYLYHSHCFGSTGDTDIWGIRRVYDKQIPFENIPEKLKTYYVDFDAPDLGHEECPMYKNKKIEFIAEIPSCFNFNDIQKIFDKENIKIEAFKNFIIGAQVMDISDMKVYVQLSPYMKSAARGNRQTLKELLELRRYIKKLININDTDDKYFLMWKDVEDEDERSKKLAEAEELYNNDRKELYLKIANLMAEKGNCWWD
jgi:hypothetical protein